MHPCQWKLLQIKHSTFDEIIRFSVVLVFCLAQLLWWAWSYSRTAEDPCVVVKTRKCSRTGYIFFALGKQKIILTLFATSIYRRHITNNKMESIHIFRKPSVDIESLETKRSQDPNITRPVWFWMATRQKLASKFQRRSWRSIRMICLVSQFLKEILVSFH